MPQKLEFWFVGTTLKKHCTTGEKKMNLKTRLKIKKDLLISRETAILNEKVGNGKRRILIRL